mmetsp:Transcript_22779/g.28093  ORF Transcript_22779/g.28093 Transcript_22779/m.28093 type:complete len:89 (+) Transcript_22779:144-410(+)
MLQFLKSPAFLLEFAYLSTNRVHASGSHPSNTLEPIPTAEILQFTFFSGYSSNFLDHETICLFLMPPIIFDLNTAGVRGEEVILNHQT